MKSNSIKRFPDSIPDISDEEEISMTSKISIRSEISIISEIIKSSNISMFLKYLNYFLCVHTYFCHQIFLKYGNQKLREMVSMTNILFPKL